MVTTQSCKHTHAKMHKCKHACMHTCTHAHMHTCTHTHMHTHIPPIYMHTHAHNTRTHIYPPYTCTHMCTYAHTCTHMHTHVHICTHMYTHAHTCAHMHTHVHTCTHIHLLLLCGWGAKLSGLCVSSTNWLCDKFSLFNLVPVQEFVGGRAWIMLEERSSTVMWDSSVMFRDISLI